MSVPAPISSGEVAPAGQSRLAALEDTHIDELLSLVVQTNASDLHIAVGLPPVLRVDGELKQAPYDTFSPIVSQRMVYDILTDEQIQKFESTFELDFSYALGRTSRFRVNIFRARGRLLRHSALFPPKSQHLKT